MFKYQINEAMDFFWLSQIMLSVIPVIQAIGETYHFIHAHHLIHHFRHSFMPDTPKTLCKVYQRNVSDPRTLYPHKTML